MNLNSSLPASSSQENLETISKNKLALRFSPELFELRYENLRDKGIDLTVEIKQNGYYTNFRFAVQLKATASVTPGKDGSLSFPVEISNLNYLLNFGMPAFYILYDHTADRIYIERAEEVYRSVLQKYRPDQLPKTYTVNFTQLLTDEKIDEVYRQTFEAGTIMKKLGPQLYFSSRQKDGIKGFVIDDEQDVYNVEQNIEFIEQVGWLLVNRREFDRIIEIEQRKHPRTKASAGFNMICGMAYYQKGQLFKAIELLKQAQSEKDMITADNRGLVDYFLLHSRYLLGMIDLDALRSAVAKIVADDNAGSFIKLDNSHHQLMATGGTPEEMISGFYKHCLELIAQEEHNPITRIMGYSKLLGMEGDLLLHELTNNYTLTLGRKQDVLREAINRDWAVFDRQLQVQYKDLTEFAFKAQDFPAINNLMMHQVQWDYKKAFHFHAFQNWSPETFKVSGPISAAARRRLENGLVVMDKVEEAYERLMSIENLYACLSFKYQLLDFMGEAEKVAAIAAQLEKLIDTYELNALRKGYADLLAGNTEHRLFFDRVAAKMTNIYEVAKGADIDQYMFEDVTEERNRLFKRAPQWSLQKLFPLEIPE
jgi:hypothetical protein